MKAYWRGAATYRVTACDHSDADRTPIEVALAGISALDSKGCTRRGCRPRAMVATREAVGGNVYHYRLLRAGIVVAKVVVNLETALNNSENSKVCPSI
ncbi:hypothetical protein B296_00053997 [Ensete ventricosum]|uniref:Uncharacterized protein n=1 Tax=Ensete ventricosum TaxID=4639 RepID=A0A426Y5R7_ENSVE|nr:hypothetical protein B296_00053997 [Ensete ventricosum]